MRNKSEYVELRDEDLFQTFNVVIEKYNLTTQKEGVLLALKQPAKRFYVSPECTNKVIARIRRGDLLAEMKQSGRDMFNELYQHFLSAKLQNPEMPNAHICEIIVEYPSSRFFITYGTAIKIINRQRKICIKRKREQLSRLPYWQHRTC